MAEIVDFKKNGKQLVMTFEAYLSAEDILRAIADENGVDVNDLSEEEIINGIAQNASADLPIDVTNEIIAAKADLIESLPKWAQTARMIFAKMEVVG